MRKLIPLTNPDPHLNPKQGVLGEQRALGPQVGWVEQSDLLVVVLGVLREYLLVVVLGVLGAVMAPQRRGPVSLTLALSQALTLTLTLSSFFN